MVQPEFVVVRHPHFVKPDRVAKHAPVNPRRPVQRPNRQWFSAVAISDIAVILDDASDG